MNEFECGGPSTYRKKPAKMKSKGQLVTTYDDDDPETVATQLYESDVSGDAENVDEAKNRLERFRVEENPVFLFEALDSEVCT
jgi:hypothetical protein